MKLVKVLTFIFFFGVLFSTITQAQINYVANTSYVPIAEETKSFIVLFSNQDRFSTDRTEEKSAEELKRLASEFDENIMEEFGSYYNPYSNSIRFNGEQGVDYTKAQLTHKDSGEIIFSFKLEKGNNAIDLSESPSGTYILIMTDDGMNIFAEEISII